MYTEFDKMTDHSKIWIYQSATILSESQQKIIEQNTKQFLSQWTAHNMALIASFNIVKNHFLIISVDEDVTNASGCSVDSLFRFIQTLEASLHLSLLNRAEIAYERGDQIHLSALNNIPELIRKKMLNEDTFIYNNTVQKKFELQTNWRIPASTSWLKRYFVLENENVASNS